MRHDRRMISVIIPTLQCRTPAAALFRQPDHGGRARRGARSDRRRWRLERRDPGDRRCAPAPISCTPARAAARSWRTAPRRAKSDWLLFLHPETALEPGWEVEAESFIDQAVMERPRAAVFRFALEDFGGEARRAEAKANLRTALFALPYGDQGLLIPKRLYQKLGGYRALADMEDADWCAASGGGGWCRLRSRAVNVARPPQERAARLCADRCCTRCACRRGVLAQSLSLLRRKLRGHRSRPCAVAAQSVPCSAPGDRSAIGAAGGFLQALASWPKRRRYSQ